MKKKEYCKVCKYANFEDKCTIEYWRKRGFCNLTYFEPSRERVLMNFIEHLYDEQVIPDDTIAILHKYIKKWEEKE